MQEEEGSVHLVYLRSTITHNLQIPIPFFTIKTGKGDDATLTACNVISVIDMSETTRDCI